MFVFIQPLRMIILVDCQNISFFSSHLLLFSPDYHDHCFVSSVQYNERLESSMLSTV